MAVYGRYPNGSLSEIRDLKWDGSIFRLLAGVVTNDNFKGVELWPEGSERIYEVVTVCDNGVVVVKDTKEIDEFEP